MQKKFIATPVAILAAFALATGPVGADDVEPDTGTDGPTTECVDDGSATAEPGEEPAGEPAETELDEIVDAAEDAAQAADDIVEEEERADCTTGRDRAKQSLQAAVDRLSEEGAGGNGVAAEVLTALINGESPSGIGAAHGREMAQAAADRRAERRAEREAGGRGKPGAAGTPDSTEEPAAEQADDGADEPVASHGKPERNGQPDGNGKPAGTGKPASPGKPDGMGKGAGRP